MMCIIPEAEGCEDAALELRGDAAQRPSVPVLESQLHHLTSRGTSGKFCAVSLSIKWG